MGSDLGTIPEPRSRALPEIDATYKSRELEGIIDLVFYRRIGFHLARFFARLNFTPAVVTVIGGVFGVVAGHLYFYSTLGLNIAGMVLHVIANIFDNVDGQLARLTNQQTRIGRILDPVVDHIVWLSIYIHLALRLQIGGFSSAIWILALVAGLSHGLQAGAADYCRNAYLYFGKGRSAPDSVSSVQQEYRQCSWTTDGWRKLLLRLYLNATREQELILPSVTRLREVAERHLGETFPAWFQSDYRVLVLPTFKWWSLLMTNTRMLLLLVLFLVRQPVWFFWIEITAGNLLLVYLILRQERIVRSVIHSFGTQNDRA